MSLAKWRLPLKFFAGSRERPAGRDGRRLMITTRRQRLDTSSSVCIPPSLISHGTPIHKNFVSEVEHRRKKNKHSLDCQPSLRICSGTQRATVKDLLCVAVGGNCPTVLFFVCLFCLLFFCAFSTQKKPHHFIGFSHIREG